jgi:hypothetical protein
MIIKTTERHMDTSMIAKRGATIISSKIPNAYTDLMVQRRDIEVKTHQGSLWSC